MNILDELDARGQVADCTDRAALAELLGGTQPVPFYIGFDPTGTSLHLGSLVPITLMARLQRAGHKPIAVVGGATGMIGDPSGKSDERQLLDPATLERNVAAIGAQLSRFLDFTPGPTGALLVNNADWTKLTYLDFLRDYGKHLTLNYMMAKESVRARLEDRDQGISYTEFSYMLLQAFDFVQLAEKYGCRLQMGATDQWGNITAGIELQRKLGRPLHLHGMVCPLLLDSTGKKMGKTATGTSVWLDANLTSPYALMQYLLNVPDADVERLLRTFSWRPLPEIAELAAAHAAAPEKRLGQRALAEDVLRFAHGDDALRRAQKASQVMFGGELDDLTDEDLAPLLADVPSTELPRATLEAGVPLVDLLTQTKLCKSKNAARELLGAGGVYLNNRRVTDAATAVSTRDLATETMLVLRAGKKSYHIVKVA
ncbi:MAG TPA: tyrosine--tRNA ligase [Kofleriaceae bacterium]|nr:tyrosine--tRNA ligase [Kofleriaceae bacterium]